MKVTLFVAGQRRMWALDLLREETTLLFAGDVFFRPELSEAPGRLTVEYPDDTLYREWIGWIAAAVGVGLISGHKIERD